MGAYIVRRVLWAILVVLIVTLLAFAIFYLLPSGDPAVRFAGKSPTPETLAEVRHQLQLDRPWIVQYGLFVKRLVVGDQYGWPGLGFSFDTRQPVLDELKDRAPRTLFLAFGAGVIWVVVGVAIGTLSALKRGSIWDRLVM